MDYLHRNWDTIASSNVEQGAREIRTTINHPGAGRRDQTAFVVFNVPILTEALGGRSSEGQQHPSDHD